MEPLMSAGELAKALKVEKHTVYHMTSHRLVPHVKLGSRVLFQPEKIREWLKSDYYVNIRAKEVAKTHLRAWHRTEDYRYMVKRINDLEVKLRAQNYRCAVFNVEKNVWEWTVVEKERP